MIQQLRHKFILTSMALVSLVLVGVLSLQVFTTYRQAVREVTDAQLQTLEMLKNGEERQRRPDLPRSEEQPPQLPREGDFRGRNLDFLRVPTFAVEVDDQGEILTLHAAPGVEVTQETAQAAADAALAKGSQRGSVPGERLSYLLQEENGRRYLVFADNSSIGQNVRRQLLVSLAILAAALGAFYLVSRFLAGRALKTAEESWEKQRQFVADASHELKTPITAILANTDIVLAHPESTVADQSKWIGYTREEAARMKSLVEDLLFLAKSDAAQLPRHPMPVELSDVVTNVLMSFESVAFEAGVALDDLVDPGITVTGDEGQLRRLVLILLDNAVKYAGDRGEVTVVLDAPGDQPRLAVRNTGEAIPPDHLPHLFERFYRADASRDRDHKTNFGGYGLGLAIAKSIVDAHGGRLTVTSEPEAGTTFTVVFPRNGKPAAKGGAGKT